MLQLGYNALLIGGALFTVITAAAGLPLQQSSVHDLFSSLPTCRRSSPSLNTCVQQWLSKFMIYLSNGSTELQIPPLDPIEIPYLETRHEDGNITLFLHLKNIKMYGFPKIKIIKVKANLEEYKLEVTSTADWLSIQGEYVSEGRILTFPLSSDGQFAVNLTDVTSAWIIYWRSVNRNGTDYLEIDRFNLDMMPISINFQAGNLLDGDNKLGEALNMVLNENSSEVYNNIKNNMMSLFSSYFTEVINSVLQHFPEKQLFPE